MDWISVKNKIDSLISNYNTQAANYDAIITFFNTTGQNYAIKTAAISRNETLKTNILLKISEYESLKTKIEKIIALPTSDSDLLTECCDFCCSNSLFQNPGNFMLWCEVNHSVLLSDIKNSSGISMFNDNTLNDNDRKIILYEIIKNNPINSVTLL